MFVRDEVIFKALKELNEARVQMQQSLGIGLDTGGTNVKCVVLDLNTGSLLSKAIAFTTPHNFSVGICNSIDNAIKEGKLDTGKVKLVSISTTLATNSILQGKGWEVGLILIGYEPENVRELQVEKTFVRGGHDAYGNELEPLDEDTLGSEIDVMSKKVEALAVSSYFGVRNWSHEIRAREIIKEMVDLPVVCGHEMSSELGMYERTTTAYLNARLLPIMKRFVDSVKISLEKSGINAPLMIVKGDGTLMHERVAYEKPVETIFSGLAASAIGCGALSKLKDYLAIDIGGTSAEVALVRDGYCKIDPEGAVIGGWRTRVKAIDMRAIGLAGDSRIWIKGGGIFVGPERVVPLSLAAESFLNLRDKVETLGTTDFLIAHRVETERLEGAEKDVYEAILKSQPVAIKELRRHFTGFISTSVEFIQNYVQRLKEKYMVEGVGLTPTDILHFNGTFTEWDVETAKDGVVAFASDLNISPKELESRVLNFLYSNMAMEILKTLVVDELGTEPSCETCFSLLNRSVTGIKGANFDIMLRAKYPIVAVGAPVKAYMPSISNSVGARLIIPTHHEVGNSVGAISGIVSESVSLEFVQMGGTCLIFGLGEPIKKPVDEGVEYVLKKAGEIAKERAVRAGAGNPQLKIEEKTLKTRGRFLPLKLGEVFTKEDLEKVEYKSITVGTQIVVTAFGKPAIGR